MTHSVHDLSAARAKQKARKNGSPPKPPASAPLIKLGTDLHRVVDESIAALATSELYQRDAELVRLVRSQEPDDLPGEATGSPLIRPCALATMRETLSRCARYEQFNPRDMEYVPVTPPDRVAAATLARGTWDGIRVLAGVTEAPVLRPDGSVFELPGYDRRTGLVYIPNCSVPPVVEFPTQAEACAALAALCEVFVDFPFVSEAARYVPIAAILTLMGRPAIAGPVPLIVADAPTRGTGKTLFTNTIAMVASGRSAPAQTYPSDPDELEKVLSACALYGSRLIALDNVTGTLGCAPLDKVLTADDYVSMRILGKTEMRELRWRALLLATANNVVLGADTARRSLMCRMEPSVERPEERQNFRHANLLAYVKEKRGELVAAALTVLRGFVAAGRPNATSFVWGGFQAWTELVPAAIVWAGGANVLAARAVSVGVPDSAADALKILLRTLPTLAPNGASAKTIVSALWPAGGRREPGPPDGFDALREAIETFVPPKRPMDTPTAQRIGLSFQKVVGRISDGRRLQCKPDPLTNTQIWWVETC